MKNAILLALSAALIATASAAPGKPFPDQLLPDAPDGFVHFVIHTEQWGSNEFYLKTEKILAVRIASTQEGQPASPEVEIFTMAPGSSSGNQRFLLILSSPEEARKAVASILTAISKADRKD